MYRETCYFSDDYESELRSLEDPAKMAAMTKVLQFPYNKPVRARMLARLTPRMSLRRRKRSSRLNSSAGKRKARGCKRCRPSCARRRCVRPASQV